MARRLRAGELICAGALIVGLAACGSSTGGTHGQSSASAVASATEAPTPVPTPTPPASFSVGQSVTTTTSAAYTVVAVAQVRDTSEFAETPSAPGGYFYGADVKICAGNNQELADPINWAVIMADDSQYQGGAFLETPSKGPALQSQTIQPGACTAGWIYFDLPASSTPAKIELENTDWYWVLAGS